MRECKTMKALMNTDGHRFYFKKIICVYPRSSAVKMLGY